MEILHKNAYDLEVENEIKRKREAEAKYKQLPLFTRLNDAIEGPNGRTTFNEWLRIEQISA